MGLKSLVGCLQSGKDRVSQRLPYVPTTRRHRESCSRPNSIDADADAHGLPAHTPSFRDQAARRALKEA